MDFPLIVAHSPGAHRCFPVAFSRRDQANATLIRIIIETPRRSHRLIMLEEVCKTGAIATPDRFLGDRVPAGPHPIGNPGDRQLGAWKP